MALKKYHVSLNLCDGNFVQGGADSTGALTTSALRCRVKVPITSKGAYTFTCNMLTRMVYGYDADDTPIRKYTDISGGRKVATFTIREVDDVAYIWISVQKQDNTQNITPSEVQNAMCVLGAYTAETMPPYDEYGNRWQDIPYRRYETATDAVTNLPVEIFTDGQPVSSYTIKGNTQTSGTPSPSNPITIDGVGNKTANLLNIAQPINIPQSSYVYNGDFSFQGESITFKSTFYCSLALVDNNDSEIINRGVSADSALTVSTPNGIKSMRIYTHSGVTDGYIMINEGSTALPYDPYGKYKISILKDSQPLTPMYFSQQLMAIANTKDEYSSSGTATYNTKKYVFTGQETWTYDSTYTRFYTEISDFFTQGLRTTPFLMTHYPCISDGRGIADVPNNSAYTGAISYDDRHRIYIKTDAYTSAADFQAFLAQQYANGTPLIFYYILQDATSESITAPTITTTGGEVTLDIDTTVKPSELDLTYHGWHEHQPLKRENGAWV